MHASAEQATGSKNRPATLVVALESSQATLAEAPADGAAAAFAIPALDSPELAWWRESMKTHDQRMQWWRDARFGLFIHWGVYSDLAGVWQGEPVEGYAEHIQRKAKIPIDVYRKEVAVKFNPTRFDADAWAKLAKDAGMGYLVITSKHHDGFAMYDSDVSPDNIVKATAWKHDPMRDLKAATARQGIRFGFYYSQAWDWGEPDGAGNDWDYQQPGGNKLLHGGRNWWESTPQMVATTARYVDRKAIPQVQELIAKYDPDLIWFDTPNRLPPSENYRIFKATREAGPNVVISSRCVPELADYISTADRPAELPPHEGDWEAIPTTNESYGYHRADQSHKPVAHFIEIIAKTAARGGNLMLNVGPRGDGTIDEKDVAILQGIGEWMRVNGDSIHGTMRTPLPVQAWGESTLKPFDGAQGRGDTLYLHVFDWPSDGKLVVGGLTSNVKHAYLLSDSARTALKIERKGDLDLSIAVPTNAPDAVDSVVVLQCDGDVICDDRRLLLSSRPNALRAFDGQLNGSTIKFGQGKRENAFVEQWTRADDAVAWPVRVTVPTDFDVSVTYDADPTSAGGTFDVKLANQTIRASVQPGQEVAQPLGKVHLTPGSLTIAVTPARIAGAELMRLRTITLTPVGK
ncbi:MAG: alpha-L-fucosidase [Tepidisphaeraceae bacterium]